MTGGAKGDPCIWKARRHEREPGGGGHVTRAGGGGGQKKDRESSPGNHNGKKPGGGKRQRFPGKLKKTVVRTKMNSQRKEKCKRKEIHGQESKKKIMIEKNECPGPSGPRYDVTWWAQYLG